jgi:hypothetical protein
VRRGLIVALAFLAAACGAGTSAGSPQAATQSAAAPATSPPATPAATPAARAFGDLAGAAANTPYKVTYTITSSAAGLGGIQTWYVSGKKFRMDLAAGPGGAAAFSVYALPEGNFMCLNLGAGAQCTDLGPADATSQSPAAGIQEQIRANPTAFSGTFKENRTIMGAATACFTLTGATPGTICYTSAGVPLYFQMQSGGTTITMEATALGVPTDADFKLPG